MKDLTSFIVNVLMLSLLIAGAQFLQNARDAQKTLSPSADSEKVVPISDTVKVAQPPQTSVRDTSTSAQPSSPSPTISPKPAVRGSSNDGEEYDD